MVDANYLGRLTTTILAGRARPPGALVRRRFTVLPRTSRTRKHGARQAHSGSSNEPIQGVTRAVSAGSGGGEGRGQRSQRAAHRAGERRHLAAKAKAVGARRCASFARHAASLAPGARGAEVDVRGRTPAAWSAAHTREAGCAGGSHGHRELGLGLHANPRDDGQSGVQAGPRDDSQDSEGSWYRARPCVRVSRPA
jgi:hypothetical protein